MAITSGVEIYDKSQNKPKDLKGILNIDSSDVKELSLDISQKELSFINDLAEEDYDDWVATHEKDIQSLYPGGLDASEKQKVKNDFASYLLTSGKVARYLNGEKIKNETFSLETAKQKEIIDAINSSKFEIEVFRSEVNEYFLYQQVLASGNTSASQGTGGNTGANSNTGTDGNTLSGTTQDKPRKTFDGNVADAKEYTKTKGTNMGIQYTADYYANIDFDEESDLDDEADKKALKRLLKGKSEALDIVDRDYKRSGADKSATKLLTRILLRIGDAKKQEINEETIIEALKTVISEYNNGIRFDMDKGWKKKAKEYGDKDQYKLGALYQIARENAQGYPYLKRVMGLLVQEFTREDMPSEGKDFSDIYNEHNDMPTSKQLELVSRKGQAIRAIEGADAQQRHAIRKLLKLAEDVNIASIFPSNSSPSDDNSSEAKNIYAGVFAGGSKKEKPSNAVSKKEKNLIKLCEEHQDDEAFAYVLDGLRAGMTIQELANAGKFDIEIGADEKAQEQGFVSRLADVNFDGKNDFGDKDMVKGLQFQSIYREAATQMHYEGQNQNQPLVNLLNFAKHIAEGTGNKKFADAIANDLLKDGVTFQEVNNFFNTDANIPLLKFLQKSLLESPLPVADILQHGTDAYQNFYDNSLEFNQTRKEKATMKYVKSKLREQGYNLDDYANPTEQGRIVQAITSFADQQGAFIGVGANVNLGEGFSIDFSIGESENKQTGLGLRLARDKSWKTGKNSSFSVGVSTGGNLVLGFIPIATVGVSVGESWLLNRKNLEKKLDATPAKRFGIGANVSLINYIPSGGFNLGYSADPMEGIEIQYDAIKKLSTQIANEALNAMKDVWNDEGKSLLAIEKALSKKFSKSSDEELHKVAFNIYRGLQAFNLEKDDYTNPIKLYQVATLLGNYYELAWKNEAVRGLHGVFLDSIGLGIQWIGTTPVPTLPIQFGKYKNLYYEDTPESQALANKAEATGDGNKVLSTSIGEKEIGLINNMLEIPFQNVKSAINQVEKSNVNQAADILLDEEKKTIKVPVDLREKNILNINLDPCLKGHIALEEDKDGKKFMVVPAEIPVRLFVNNTGTQAIYVLNLGDTKSDGGKKTVVEKQSVFEDVMLRSGVSIPSDWLGNPSEAIFEKITKVEDINTLLTSLNIGDYKNFPLRSAEKSKEKGKENQTIFTLAPQTNGKPDYLVLSPELVLDKTTNKLTLSPDVGELVVNYAKDKNAYTLSYKAEPADKLKISYKIDELTASEASATNRSTPEMIDFKNVTLFEFVSNTPLAKANALIGENKKILMNKEYTANGVVNPKFKDFMDNLWNIEAGNYIDKGKLDNAKSALLTILGTKNELSVFINGLPGDDYKTLSYVMDRMKQIFAMERYGSSLTAMWNKRGERYHNISCPSKEAFPESLTRDLVKDKGSLTEKFDGNGAQEYSNLFGYTAFYRKEGSPAWSMTAPGSTTVYKEFISYSLEKEQLADAKTRFLGNLEKQTYEKELMLEAIKSKIPQEYRDQIKTEDLLGFLTTGEKILSIDNGQKKYKLTLNASYHFYLLGECANESLGIKINDIKIQKYTPGTGVGAESSGEIPYSYDNEDIGLQINTAQTRNEAFRGKKSTAGFSIAGGWNKTKSAEGKPIDRGNTIPDPDNPIDRGNTIPDPEGP